VRASCELQGKSEHAVWKARRAIALSIPAETVRRENEYRRSPVRNEQETSMASVLYMSMSLDGFVAQRDEDPGPLHEWVFPGADGGDFDAAVKRLTGVNRQIYDEFMSTGAVVAGRGTFEPAGGWGGDHHDGVPIWILSRHQAPEWVQKWPLVHYVPDLADAMREAKTAAGDKDVLVHGAGIAQRAIPAGLLDEIEIHLVPVLFGEGRRLFDHLGLPQRKLERVRVLEGESGVVHMRYRIAK
jgi:dihydrofolate reductase